MGNWYNKDGLNVLYGTDEGRLTGAREIASSAAGEHVLRIPFTYDSLPDFTADADGDGTNDRFTDGDICIPANCVAVSCNLHVRTAFAGGTSYTVGVYEADGTVVDADGLMTAANVPLASIDAKGNYVVGTGAVLAGAAVTADTVNNYIKMTASGTFTAGAGELIIKYVVPGAGGGALDGDLP